MAVLPGWNRLRIRLLALLLLTLVPASALLLQSNFDRRRAEARHIREEALRLARLAARDEERLFEETRRLLMGIASHPDVRSGDPGRCVSLLTTLLGSYPQYGNFFVADTAGQLVCSAKPNRVPVDISDRTYFREALRTRDFGIGDYQVGRVTQRASLHFGYPILDAGGQSTGIAAAALDLEWFSDFAAHAQLPSNVVVLVVDRHRVILAHVPDGAAKWIGRRVPDNSELAPLLDEGQGATEVNGLDGMRKLYGVAQIGSGRSRVAVAVGMPVDGLSEADRTLYRSLALLVLIGLITGALAWAGVEAFVVRPLDSLRTATHRLAAGDLSSRAALKSGIEQLDSLGRNFDDMVHALQQREAEEHLSREAREEAEEKYRHLVEQSLVGVYLVHNSGMYVNPKFASIFGYTPEEMKDISFLNIVLEADRPMVLHNVGRRLSGELSAMEYSFRGKRKDGTVVTVHVHGAMTTYRGKPAIMGILIDQTEQKLLEQQLQQSQKMEAIGRLAGGVAHDFNNLLTVIQGYSEFLHQQLPASSPEREQVDEILKAAESAANLTRQLLAFSRHQVLQPEVLSLNQVIAGFDKMTRRLIGEDIRVELQLEPALALVKVDPGQIEQVILNLAVNARDAMPNGGTLTIQTANIALDEHYVRQHAGAQVGPHVLLAVSDTGVGMTPETQARVFEPFFTTKEHGKGTGLGLSTVYGIVKQSGGSIWLYSEVGRGTTVKIFLPLADTGVLVAASAAPARPDRVAGTETVAVVEDDHGVRGWVSEALQQLGYTVLPLASPQEALALASRRANAIDLLLTDVVLQNLSGPELAARLQKRWPAMKILYMSGYSDEAMLPQGLLGERDRVLQKPFTATALAERVRETLDRVDVDPR
ncbi:MAG: PAS domain S-box protein [Acidobacteria bacterium]|nr:PAS domain S-box protein [Acidobacteriota bacterium]